MDARVEAIREHSRIGLNTDTHINNTFTDEELSNALNDAAIETVEASIEWAIEQEDLILESGLNQRWGEDDDPQLQRYQDFNDPMSED